MKLHKTRDKTRTRICILLVQDHKSWPEITPNLMIWGMEQDRKYNKSKEIKSPHNHQSSQSSLIVTNRRSTFTNWRFRMISSVLTKSSFSLLLLRKMKLIFQLKTQFWWNNASPWTYTGAMGEKRKLLLKAKLHSNEITQPSAWQFWINLVSTTTVCYNNAVDSELPNTKVE